MRGPRCQRLVKLAFGGVDVYVMTGALTRAELNDRVAEIGRETTRRLHLVPFEGRYGDWQALIHKHRAMLSILESSRESVGELQPPADRAHAYRLYLVALDRQLVLERAVLAAANTHDIDAYKNACRILAEALRDRDAACRHAGLRSFGPTLAKRTRIWVTLPWYLLKAHRHARAEHRAGRSWRSA